ncbi:MULTISPECIES: GNAT family N-acetyltransferase [Aliivibrio]|jgi:predicted N-acetyltransferase YhbS|uniref:GCN5 family acetyltransferase n=3 Tax=Aliivibrio TaxID=511678 RepID=A0A1B9P055_ALILO|nr:MULTISPECIES: GNAT family N-acetyltransferase [Aliivibrio]AZL84713.1 N-acetyltransferase [Aliivibrio salmonicida]MBB1315259.1 GNAT family N-acetyltransferase [Aliivibrio sp. SR45-2]OCH21701.1 GCN5 family acetyltransferase [Aliivibrio logei]OEF12645.1 GNAT family N-acetyltransferase [Aliivibrio logei 5S-186]CAQ79104.1 putative acetyltransferase [Aliivibrio salmonicida LFI1238]
MEIDYKVNEPMSAEQFIELLKKTTLGARRPIDDVARIQAMLDNSNLIVTAWGDGELIGVARSVTDFNFCCYLSDLAVDESVQSMGVGKYLILVTKEEVSPECKLILLSAPQAEGYYPKIGFEAHNSAWVLSDESQLKLY